MLEGFADYWREAPPVNELVAAWLGAQGSGSSSAPKEDIGDLLSMMPRAV